MVRNIVNLGFMTIRSGSGANSFYLRYQNFFMIAVRSVGDVPS